MTRDAEGNLSAGEPTLEEAGRERRTSMGTKILSTITAVFLTAALAASVGAQQATEHVTRLGNVSSNIDAAAPVFAQEIFGPNSGSVKLTLAGTAVVQYQAATATPGGTVSVDPGETAVFTYSFSGARLAEPISAGDLSYSNAADFSFSPGRDGGGGEKGDNFVSYTVTATAGAVPKVVSGQMFTFRIPDLEMVTVAGEKDADDRRIILTVTIDPPARSRFSGGANTFPKYPVSSTAMDTTSGPGQPGPRNQVIVARIDPAYELSVVPPATSTEPNTASINLNDPTMITATSTAANLIQVSGLGDSAMSGIKLSSVTVSDAAGNQRTADNTADFSAGTTDMFRIAVTGNFAAADRLFLSGTTSGNVTYSRTADTLLTISADGTSAEGARPLAGTGALAIGTQHALYFVPGGGQIQRGTIGTMYSLDFASATARDSAMGGKDLTLEYSGISFTNYAYAIPGPNAADVGNLRVRCEGASDCVVFFRCMDTAGMNVGGFERANIGAGSVTRMSSMDIATMLGVEDWTGRLSCTIHSSSRVSVQLLVRSGGTLTNNTFIGGLDAAQ